MTLSLPQKIEALLFYTTEAMTASSIAKILKVEPSEIVDAVATLKESLVGHGIELIENNETYMLGTSSEASQLLEAVRKEELGGDLTRAALETLTIITYKNGITKSEIDYIRGVNSNYILRNLMMRGLIERQPNEADKRSPLYCPTLDTLSYLGITSIKELPRYEQSIEQLMMLQNTEHSENNE